MIQFEDQFNNSKIKSLIDKLAQQFGCIFGDEEKVYYISIPISSGMHFINWYKSKGVFLKNSNKDLYYTEHYNEVIVKNTKRASEKIKKLRKKLKKPLIDPTKLDIKEWEQDEYRYYWGRIIQQYVNKAIFSDGWEYSNGCSFEFLTAKRHGIKCYNEQLEPLKLETALMLMQKSINELKRNNIDTTYLKEIYCSCSAEKLKKEQIELNEQIRLNRNEITNHKVHDYKDEILNNIAFSGNVAQFVSFRPSNNEKLSQSFCRVNGFKPNFLFESTKQALVHLMQNSPEKTLNIRRYKLGDSKGYPLDYGISDLEKIEHLVKDYASQGFNTIVNETVDKADGGVSGVANNGVIEFSPNATPKCVDTSGLCDLPRDIGMELLSKVYGFRPKINYAPRFRVEFSIHPIRRGFLREHTIIWELGELKDIKSDIVISWPNNFSRFLGDKLFGLLIAECLGLPVPYTVAISRKVPPFNFGKPTGTGEYWIRTCPETAEPGYYETEFGWKDPYEFMNAQAKLIDFDKPIMSIIAQQSVESQWSGALIPSNKVDTPIIEGVRGHGDQFMTGKSKEKLPDNIKNSAKKLYQKIIGHIGPVKIEWAHDGHKVWCLQIRLSKNNVSFDNIIVPAKNDDIKYIEFKINPNGNTKLQLDELRKVIKSLKGQQKGIALIGDVGITSHYGEVLKDALIPSKIIKRRE